MRGEWRNGVERRATERLQFTHGMMHNAVYRHSAQAYSPRGWSQGKCQMDIGGGADASAMTRSIPIEKVSQDVWLLLQ